MLKNILSITGKSGLYRLVSRGNNMLIVESLEDGKRIPTYQRDKIVSLADISMYTLGEDKPLHEVLDSLKNIMGGAACTLDVKKADSEQLREFFAQVLPDFDRDRVYPSDIRKLIQWYNALLKAGITEFAPEEESAEEEVAVAPVDKKEEKKAAPKKSVKTQKSAATSVKTGVGAKRG